MEALTLDFRFALRALRRTPAFTVTAVLILALSIGMASAMFTVFDAVLLKPLPVQDPDRIVEVSGVGRGAAAGEFPLLLQQYQRFSVQARTVQDVAGFAHWRVVPEVLTDGDRWITLRQSAVTANFFQVLGARPLLGRMLRPEDAHPWAAQASNTDLSMVISYDTWRRVFGGDSSVIGRHLAMPLMKWNLIIVGVAPPGLDYPRGAESWLAVTYNNLDVVARLAPGATAAAVRDEYVSFLDHDPDNLKYFGAHTVGAQVHGLLAMVVGAARPALFALSGAVALLLLLASVNIANLQLLRGAGRIRELAIRRAMGATSADLIRQLLVESLVVALAGGALGLGLAAVLLKTLPLLVPQGLPRADVIALAGAPLVISALVTLLTLLLFAVAPSLSALRLDIVSPMRSDARAGTVGKNLRMVRQGLVAWQFALALVVLAGAALLGRSFARLAGLDLGYATDQVSVLQVTMPWQRWSAQCGADNPGPTAADSARAQHCFNQLLFDFHDRIMGSMRQLPDVASISPVAVPPFLGQSVWMGKIAPEEESAEEAKRNPFFGLETVGPEFFRTMSMRVLAGRDFTEADRDGAAQVAIITEGVARRFWPNQNVIGKRFREASDSLVTIVGVVPDLHYQDLPSSTPTVFRPFRQVLAQGYFVVKTRGQHVLDLTGVRRAVMQVDPEAQVLSATPMDALVAPQLSRPRFDMLLLSAFGFAALMLAAIGLYGIMASAVSQQTREFGVRIALGATPELLRRNVLAQALKVAGIGAAVGLAAAFAGARALTSLLFGVKPSDPVALLGACGLLIAVAVLAALVPAQRTMRIDPSQIMRADT